MRFRAYQAHAFVLMVGCLLTSVAALSAVPFFEINNKYIETGSYSLSTTSLYGNTSANSQVWTSFNSPLLAPHSSYAALTNLQQFNFQIDALQQFNMTSFICGQSTTYLVNCLVSMQFSSLAAVAIRYLVLDSPYVNKMSILSTAIFYIDYGGTQPFDVNNPVICNFGIPTMNIAGNVKSYVFFNGLNGTATTSANEFDIKLVSSYPDPATFTVTATSSTNSVILGAIMMTILGLNLDDAQVWPFPAMWIDSGTFNPTTPYLDPNNTFQTYNTFWGVTWLGVSNQAFIEWSSPFTVNTSMSAASANPYNHLQWLGMVFWVKQCKSPTVYYMMSNDTCYDICPDYYWEDSTNWLCQNCTAYDCLKCAADQTCTLCDNVTAHRQLSAGRCIPLNGYYETGVTIAPPCDPNCLTCDTTSTYCLTCYPYYYLDTSSNTCVTCEANCINCTSATSCTLCDTLYMVDSTTSTCVANCSEVTGCVTCTMGQGSIICQTCIVGLMVNASNYCVAFCGDGVVAGSQTCDDNNTVDGDGCSSNCTIESAHYCSGTPSVCGNCSIYCLACNDSVNCTQCDALAPWNTSVSACSPNCSEIASCLTCDISYSLTPPILCLSCDVGYALGPASDVCLSVCGDSLIVGSEGCDDGNTNNGDGCSSSCNVQLGFYCNNLPAPPSVCAPCMQYCLSCSSSTVCTQCNLITVWDPTNSVCFANCSTVTQCSTCTVSTSNSVDYIKCLSCSGGYSVDPTLNICKPVCGDGIVAPEEQCDDGNNVNRDGCDSSCSVQKYFSCNISATTNTSVCFLSSLSLSLIDIIKNDNKNSGVMHLQPSPSSLPLYSTIDWANVITTPNSSVTISNITYDPATNLITVNFDYSSTIQDQTLQIEINTANDTQLSGVAPFNVSLKAVSDDNQALVYYSDSNYSLGKIVSDVSTGLGATAFLFLLAGTFGGRLIGLQCAAVIQIAYISTLSLQNLSPSFKSLQQLYLCLGYNKLKSYDYSQSIQRPFKSGQIDKMFIYNYNIMGLLILLPLVVAVICKLVAKKKASQKEQEQTWNNRAKYCLGQFTLYALLSFSYLAYLSLFVQLKYMQSSTFDFLGVGTGVFLIVLALFYLFFYAQADTFYTEFKDKFNADSFSRRFYILPILQRILSPAILTMLVTKSYSNCALIGLYLFIGAIILLKQPYKGDRKNYRPVANYLIAIAIQGIYMIVGFAQDPTSFLSLYGPLMVLVLLIVCVVYSAYALIQDLREKIANCGKNDDVQNDELEMNEMTAKYFRQENSLLMNLNLLNKSNNLGSILETTAPLTPNLKNTKLNLSEIKEKLQDKKNSSDRAGQEQINIENLGEMLDEQAI